MTPVMDWIFSMGGYVMIEKMKKVIEPGLMRVFRYFAAVAMVYFAILSVVSMFTNEFGVPFKFQLSGNFFVYLGLLVYLNLPQIEKRLKSFYLPFGLSVASVFPIIGNITYLFDLQHTTVFTIISRSWLWLPILFVPLVLIAWQYNFKSVMVFTLCTNGLELIVMLAAIQNLTYENITLISVPLLRTFAFGTVGYIVNTMAITQSVQNDKLIKANQQLFQYLDTLEQLATTRERTRLAGELHDTLAHTLSGLSINLEAIKTAVDEDNADAQGMLDHSLQITRSGLDETRRVIKALRAGPLEELGLEKALKNLVQEASVRKSIPIHFSFPDRLPIIPMEVEQSIYRIIQEALENILRHSDATNADVKITANDDLIEVLIQDDGKGFHPEAALNSERFGLQGLKERAVLVGGKLFIESQPLKGTIIRFIWERFND